MLEDTQRWLNRIIREIPQIRRFFSKEYLNEMNREEPFNTFFVRSQIEQINTIKKIEGYSLFQSQEQNEQILQNSAQQLVSAVATNAAVMINYYLDGNRVNVSLGTCIARNRTNGIDSLKSNLQNCTLINSLKIASQKALKQAQIINGVIVGDCCLEIGDIDTVLKMMETIGESGMITFMAYPIDKKRVNQTLNEINTMIEHIMLVSNNQYKRGANHQQEMGYKRQNAFEVLTLLKNEQQRLSKGMATSLWQISIFVSASNEKIFWDIGNALVGRFQTRQENRSKKIMKLIPIGEVPTLNGYSWLLPVGSLTTSNYSELYVPSFTNILEMKELATLFYLPIESHNGFTVRRIGETRRPFVDVVPTRINRRNYEIGKLAESKATYAIDFNKLRQHVFVCGATQFGKTTTVKNILYQAQKEEIPFIVVEAAKKNYWELKLNNGFEKLKIYSVGRDAKSFYINPFEPEDGTLIGTHSQNLSLVLTSLFEQEAPLPQIIKELVSKCYTKKGWGIYDVADKESHREYPTMQDLLNNVDETIDEQRYSRKYSEVRENIKGALHLRIKSLVDIGESISTQKNMSAETLFRTSAIIELEEFSTENKAFITSIIAMKVEEYAKQKNATTRLENLLIIEEAHHLMPSQEHAQNRNQIMSSQHFSTLLAEISGYGTGIIIVDQRPSYITSSALANTATKIIHHLQEHEDIDAIANSMGLIDTECEMVRGFGVGEAVIITPDDERGCHVYINNSLENRAQFNFGYLFCSVYHSQMVLDTYTRRMIESAQRVTPQLLYDCIQLQDMSSIDEKICFAGMLLEKMRTQNITSQQKRRLLFFVYKRLGGQ